MILSLSGASDGPKCVRNVAPWIGEDHETTLKLLPMPRIDSDFAPSQTGFPRPSGCCVPADATDYDKLECHQAFIRLKSMVDTCASDVSAHGPQCSASITTEVLWQCEILLASSCKTAKSWEIFFVPTLPQDYSSKGQFILQVHNTAPYCQTKL